MDSGYSLNESLPPYVSAIIEGYQYIEKQLLFIQSVWRQCLKKRELAIRVISAIKIQRRYRVYAIQKFYQTQRKNFLIERRRDKSKVIKSVTEKNWRCEQNQSNTNHNFYSITPGPTNTLYPSNYALFSQTNRLFRYYNRPREELPMIYHAIPSVRRDYWDLIVLIKEKLYKKYRLSDGFVPQVKNQSFASDSMVDTHHSQRSIYQITTSSSQSISFPSISGRSSMRHLESISDFTSKNNSVSKRSSTSTLSTLSKSIILSISNLKQTELIKKVAEKSVKRTYAPEDLIDMIRVNIPSIIPAKYAPRRRSSIYVESSRRSSLL